MEDLNKRIENLEKDIEALEKDFEIVEKEVMVNSKWRIIFQWLLVFGAFMVILLYIFSLQAIW